MKIMKGNAGWHTDSSYMPVSAKASIPSAHVVPLRGGQTEWADMPAAWEALDEDTRARAFDHAEARLMKHVRISGEPATEGVAP